MPSFKHVVELDYTPTFRTEKVAAMFDVPVTEKLRKEWDIDIPIEDREWSVGLIVGASGSGKSTIAAEIFKEKLHNGFSWGASCLLDDFPQSCDTKTITETLSKVGFSSPPQWLLPYSALSTGQKFRVELARCLLEYGDIFVFDEFTSVVDRQVAQVGSFAFQKSVRKSGRQFVAVTCHYDVEEWLQPDWVYDVSTSSFRWGCLRRPEIKLEIYRCHDSTWRLFSEHHYLTAEISRAAFCFVGCIDGRPVVFDAWLPFFGRLSGDKKGMRGHRTVCIPDFQGLGLGNRLFTECAKMWAGLGYRVFSGTAHPAEIKKRIESIDWIMTRKPSRTGKDKAKKTASNRLSCGFEFVGETMPQDEAKRFLGR